MVKKVYKTNLENRVIYTNQLKRFINNKMPKILEVLKSEGIKLKKNLTLTKKLKDKVNSILNKSKPEYIRCVVDDSFRHFGLIKFDIRIKNEADKNGYSSCSYVKIEEIVWDNNLINFTDWVGSSVRGFKPHRLATIESVSEAIGTINLLGEQMNETENRRNAICNKYRHFLSK